MIDKVKTAWEIVKTSPLRIRIVLLLAVLYLLSPIDLIPDFIPIIGQLDDLLVVGLVIKYVAKHAQDNEELTRLIDKIK